jgi:DNA-binding LacI/PurR family transcriptional regulator
MITTVDKNDKLALPIQLSEQLLSAIESGTFSPGSRLPSGRELAKQFGVSRGTVIEALNILEEKHCIERIAAKGIYVSDDVKHELKKLKIIFPFPEESISLSTINRLENWIACSDIYHGMILEAKELNAELIFQHFDTSNDKRILERQMRSIKNYDGAIFLGELLSDLRQEMFNTGKTCILISPCAQFIPPYVSSLISIDNNREIQRLAEHIAERGYERLWIITGDEKNESAISYKQQTEKNMTLSRHAEEMGIRSLDSIIAVDNQQPLDFKNILSEVDFSSGKEAIFFNNCDSVVPFYEYCHENGLRIGQDIGVVGYASGITFNNLVPSMTYSKINNLARGQLACRMIVDKIRNHNHDQSIEIVSNKLIIGKSTGYLDLIGNCISTSSLRHPGAKL